MAQLQQLQLSFGSTEAKAVELSNARISALIAAIGTKRTGSDILVTQSNINGESLLSGWIKPQEGQTVSESNAYVLKKNNVSVSGEVEAEEYSLLTDGTNTLYEGKQMLISCVNESGVQVAMQSMVTWIFLDFNYRIRESALVTDEEIRSQFNVTNWVNLGNNKYRGTLLDTTGVIKLGVPQSNYSWSIPVEVRAYPASIDEDATTTDAIRTARLTEAVSFNAQAISVNNATVICNSNNIKVGDNLTFQVSLLPTNNTKLEFNSTYTAEIACQELTNMGTYFTVPAGLENFTVNATITYMGRQFAVTQTFAVEHTILSNSMNPTVWTAVYNGLKAADEANGTTRWADLTLDSEFGTGDAMRVNESEFLQIELQMRSISSSFTFEEGQYFGGFSQLRLYTTSTTDIRWFGKCTSLVLNNNLKKIILAETSSTSVGHFRLDYLTKFVADGIEEIVAEDIYYQRLILFSYSSYITSVSMKSLNKISARVNSMFDNCTSIKNISFPNLSYIETRDYNSFFSKCTSLESVSLPKLETIYDRGNNNMFNGCTKLTSVDLSSLKTISTLDTNNTFYGCTALTQIELPSLEQIVWTSSTKSNRMFYGCTLLESFKAKKLSILGMAEGVSGYVTNNIMFYNCYNLEYVEMGTDADSLVFNNIQGYVQSAEGMFHKAGNNKENIKVFLNNLSSICVAYLFSNCYFLFSDTKTLDWSNTKLSSLTYESGNNASHSILYNNKTILKIVFPSTLTDVRMGEYSYQKTKVLIVDVRKCTNLTTTLKLLYDTRDKMLFFHITANTPPQISHTTNAPLTDKTYPYFVGATTSSKQLVDSAMQRYFESTNWSTLYNALGYQEQMADYNAWLSDPTTPCVWEKGGDTQYAGLTVGQTYYKKSDGTFSTTRTSDSDEEVTPTTAQVHASNVNMNRIFPQYMYKFMCKSVLGKTYDEYKTDMNAALETTDKDYDYEDITPELLEEYGLTIPDE